MKQLVKVCVIFLIGMAVFLVTGCQKEEAKDSVSVVGSSSVAPLAEFLGIEFSENQRGVNIDVQSVGSSAGIKGAQDGTADIGMSSRALKDEEKTGLEETLIALDGIVLIVHKDNPVSNLTTEQIEDIFRGKITNWKELGGEDRKIVVISREEGSGTRTAFEEIAGLEDKRGDKKISAITLNAIIADGNGAIKQNVTTKKGGIGYVSIGSVDSLVKGLSVDGVMPSEATVKDDTYKFKRGFLFLTKDTLTPMGRAFIDFALSPEGQKIVEEEHYISVD